jgi:hypothetical protein
VVSIGGSDTNGSGFKIVVVFIVLGAVLDNT